MDSIHSPTCRIIWCVDRAIEEKKHVNTKLVEALREDRISVVDSRPIEPMVVPERVFQTLLYGWANISRKVRVGQQRMRDVLELMSQEATYDEQIREEIQKLLPSHVSFHTKDRDDDNPDQRANPLSCQPSIQIYNTLLQGLANASHRSIAAAIEAEHVLHKMQRIHIRKGWHTKPNSKSFTLVINAFARTGHATAGERAERILRKMIDFHEEEKAKYREETGWEYQNNNDEHQKRIVTPDAVAYAGAIKAHADSNSDGSALKALGLLLELLKSKELAPQVDPYVFANTIQAFTKAAERKKSAKSRLNAAERAEQIFWVMVDELKGQERNQGSTNVMENEDSTETENDDSKSGTMKGEQGAHDDSSLESPATPTSSNLELHGSAVVPFNACLNTWSQSNVDESAPRAEKLLRRILEDPALQGTIGIRPNSRSFNTCLNAWARASRRNPNAAQKAEKLLEEMITESKHDSNVMANGNARIQPDAHSFAAAMNAHGRSNNKRKTIYARRLLDQLVSMRVPSIVDTMSAVPYTVVLNAAAHSDPCSVIDDGTLDAFGAFQEDGGAPSENPYAIAQETYFDLCQDSHDMGVVPDHLAFASMLEVVARHTAAESIERRQMVENVFEDACVAGQVSSLVLHALKKACPSQEMLHLLLQASSEGKATKITVEALPREWTRYVAPRFLKAKKQKSYKH